MNYKVALIILYDSEKRLLLQHRTKDAKLLPDHWAFFGGGLDQDETPDDAVRREAFEELNYMPKAPKLLFEQDFTEGATNGHLYVYLEAFKGDKATLKLQEGQGWGWFKEYETGVLKMIGRDRHIVNYITDYLEKKRKNMGNLSQIAEEVRKLVIEAAWRSKSAHVGSSLSCVDLLISLYFYEMNINVTKWNKRDIFVLSKAHAAMALYSVLTIKGIMDRKTFEGYMLNNGTLPAHLDRFTAKGIEVSAGSLGHGFNMALGMAYGYKIKKDNRKVFVLIGDGESQEGSIWEGALFAPKLNIDNVTVFLDYNNLQGYGRPTELCCFEPVIDKWKAFGWEVFRVNGHNFIEIVNALEKPNNGKPKIIIADTIKGKGVHFMEDEMKWHYFVVTDEFKEKALQDLSR